MTMGEQEVRLEDVLEIPKQLYRSLAMELQEIQIRANGASCSRDDLEPLGRIIAGFPCTDFAPSSWSRPLAKSAATAAACKEQGNAVWKSKDKALPGTKAAKALQHWTAGLRFTPVPSARQIDASTTNNNNSSSSSNSSNSETAALLHANRSLVLFNASMYHHAHHEISRAIGAGYPNASIHRLLIRKASILERISVGNELESPEMALHQALDIARQIKDASAQQAAVEALAQYKKRRAIRPVGDMAADDDLVRQAMIRIEPSILPPSPQPMCHPDLEVAFDPAHGRSIVAAQDIPAHTLLLVEAPLAWTAYRDVRHQYCAFCLRPVASMGIYCQTCSSSEPYCSESCRSRMAHLHAFECGKRSMAQIDEHSLLALRLHRSVGAYRESPDMIEALGWPAMATRIKTRCRNVPGFAPTGGEYLSDHVAVTHLVSNLDKVDIRQFAADLIPLSISSHFNEDIAGKSGELASVIQSFAQVGFNSITIDSICRDTDEPMVAGYMAMKKQNVGSGIYATASLLNHSCDPNTHMYFTNSHLHVRTTRLVRKGEAVTTSYTPTAARSARESRQAELSSRWCFDCSCTACTAADDLAERRVLGLVCDGCKHPLLPTDKRCSKCCQAIDWDGIHSGMERLEQAFLPSVDLFLQDPLRLDAAARMLADACNTFLDPCSLKAGGLHDSLAAMYAHVGVLNGREGVLLPKAVALLGKSIEAVERAFGSTSPQSAYEQLKLAHLTAMVSCKQAIDVFGHCIRMFETLFGPDAPELADLKGAMAAQQRVAGSAFSPLDLAHDAARAQAAAFACLARPPTAASC